MATFGDCMAALSDFRIELQTKVEEDRRGRRESGASAFAVRGAFAALATPATNVHATGVGIRVRGGKLVPSEFVLKLYVFDKIDLESGLAPFGSRFRDVDVDVEPLPVQRAFAAPKRAKVSAQAAPTIGNRGKFRPVVGGVSVAPLGAPYVGTLGCFVRRQSPSSETLFALSNNHVFADVNQLAIGTPITQPGPEVAPMSSADVIANLSDFIPIGFPGDSTPVPNRFDAAIAQVSDPSLLTLGAIHDLPIYQSSLKAPAPGMRVTKSGRTTGVTTGTITAINVNGVQVNYGDSWNPRIAVFNETIEIVGDGGPFSRPGDSGSVILDASDGRPVALLFAGDSHTTTACDLAAVCRRFQVLPA